MAINPNTDFSPGAVFTAGQADRFPRGVMGFVELTTNTNSFTSITTVASATFTAEANRYYKITFQERFLIGVGGATQVTMTIANGTTVIQESMVTTNTSFGNEGTAMVVKTFTAGSITINARLSSTGATNSTAGRGATNPSFLLIEDIGPA